MFEALFWIFSAVAVASAAGVVLNLRNTVAAALSLVVTMLALACLFVMLEAQFVGLIQVMVYAGAIVVLFLFVIMLLNLRADSMGADSQPGLKLVGLAVAVAVTFQLAAVVAVVRAPWAEVGPEFGTTRALGEALYTDFVLPFEIAGVLLLAGIVGAVVLAKKSLE
jgi:NADH-quinone oxidoreductase subunit J